MGRGGRGGAGVSRRWTSWVAVGLAILLSPVLMSSQSLVPTVSRRVHPVVASGHPAIQASLDRIATGSALWRQAVQALEPSRRTAAILTADQVLVADATDHQTRRRFDATVLAEVAPIPGPDDRVERVVVVVNLALLEASHRARGSHPWELHDDLDRILIHEVYGHALPYLLVGDLSGRCADPQRDERPEHACAIQRENAVRAELGLGRRRDAGLDGLALMRPASR